jgi:hypothetical protein
VSRCQRTKGCTLDGEHTGACLPFSIPTTLTPRPRCDGNHAAPRCAARDCWQGDAPAVSGAVLTGEVGPRDVTVPIPSGAEGVVVGPEDVLVIAFATDLNPHQMRVLRAELENRLPGERFTIVAGYNAHLAVMRGALTSKGKELPDGVLRASLPPA